MPRILALVIGNNKYQTNPLENCLNDATDLARILESINCKVDLHEDLTSDNMYEAIKGFTETIRRDDFVIFYFAGHAVQWGDQNFLMPCDNKKIISGADMRRYATNAQESLDQMANMEPHFVLFLLDCCRQYWLPTTTRATNSEKNQVGGLNTMIARPGTLIAFACAPGQTTSDQSFDRSNGLFTKHLLKHITAPAVDIQVVLRRVANDVARETHNKQIPYQLSSIMTENIFLVPAREMSLDDDMLLLL